MLAPPPGDAYNFILNVITYPLSVVNFFVAAGLIYLYVHPPLGHVPGPIRATIPVAIIFLLANVFLIVAPFIPPVDGQNVYESLPYWLHCVVGIGFFGLGAAYWLIWAVILPKLGGYQLVRETLVGEDGWSRTRFVKHRPE